MMVVQGERSMLLRRLRTKSMFLVRAPLAGGCGGFGGVDDCHVHD